MMRTAWREWLRDTVSSRLSEGGHSKGVITL